MSTSKNENIELLTSIIFDVYHIVKKLDISNNINCLKNEIDNLLLNIDKLKEVGLKTQDDYLFKDFIKRAKWILTQTTTCQSSWFIRYILNEKFNIIYKTQDSELISCLIPYSEIPKVFANIENSVKDYKNIENIVFKKKSVSNYFSKNNYHTTYPFDSDKTMHTIINSILTKNNLLFHERFMLWYDNIFENYNNSTNALFSITYSITDISWKYYIAIMAVSTVKSEYMLSFLENEFLLTGGEISWIIEGIKSSTMHKKLKELFNINNLIAHQPWKLQVKDIKDMLVYWTKEELLDALLIIVHFQRQATLIESLKVELKETDFETEQISDLLYYKYTKNENNLYNCLEELNLEEDDNEENNKLRIDNKDNIYNSINISNNNLNTVENTNDLKNNNKKSINKNNTSCKDSSSSINNINKNFYNSSNDLFKISRSSRTQLHVSDYCTIYQDFDPFSTSYLCTVDFNWNDQGVFILENISPDIISVVNKELEAVFSLTSKTIGGGNKLIDTFHFRNAIKSYTELILGIYNDDFKYQNMNKLIKINNKIFIKNVVCYPSRITKQDLILLRSTFSYEEIYHLIMISAFHKSKVQLTFISKCYDEIIKGID